MFWFAFLGVVLVCFVFFFPKTIPYIHNVYLRLPLEMFPLTKVVELNPVSKALHHQGERQHRAYPNIMQSCMENKAVVPEIEIQRSHSHPAISVMYKSLTKRQPDTWLYVFHQLSRDITSESRKHFSLFPVHQISKISETLHLPAMWNMCMKTVCFVATRWEALRAKPQVPTREAKHLSTFRLEALASSEQLQTRCLPVPENTKI